MERLARMGVVVASPDFRMPPEGPYPVSVSDIHLSIRWLKAHAKEFGSKPELVGGYAREGSTPPLPYTESCRPQAWAAAALIYVTMAK